MALVLSGLYECACNNSLKPYHGEIIRPCYSGGHYRSTTCITSSLLIPLNGCWGAHQESRSVSCARVYVHACFWVRFSCERTCVWGLFSPASPCLCPRVCARLLARAWGCTCSACSACSACSYVVFRGVCMHVDWHLAKCGGERGNIWLIIEVPWKKYDHESVLGLRAQLLTSSRSTRQQAQPALRLPCHPEGWLQCLEMILHTKWRGESAAHSRQAILMTKSIGRGALISIKKRISGWMQRCPCDSTAPVIWLSWRMK